MYLDRKLSEDSTLKKLRDKSQIATATLQLMELVLKIRHERDFRTQLKMLTTFIEGELVVDGEEYEVIGGEAGVVTNQPLPMMDLGKQV